MMKTLRIMVAALAVLLSQTVKAQEAAPEYRWSIATNLLDYVNLGTLNVEAQVAVARHWSFGLQARYNDWNFNRQSPEHQIQNRKRSFAATARLYRWHIYSGWFFSTKLQYQEYNRNNFLWGKPREATEEGDAFGMGLGFGYDYMLHPNINLEFGASFWGGYKTYARYDCPVCGVITSSGSGGFILPDLLFVSLQFVF